MRYIVQAVSIVTVICLFGAPVRTLSEGSAVDVEVLSQEFDNPWAVVTAPDGDLYITETRGRISIWRDDRLIGRLKGIPDVKDVGQGGLLDLAFHPNYPATPWLYLSYSTTRRLQPFTRVTRFKLTHGVLSDPHPILDGDTGTDGAHFGSRLLFDKNGYLFITLGERHRKEKAQELSSLLGKIVRLNDDGSIPNDNPFFGRKGVRGEIYSLGHRNPQGIDEHPRTGAIYVTEHGPSGYDAPPGGDEINLLKAGFNYGWPIMHHRMTRPGMEPPVIEYTPAIAPSGAIFYRGNIYPQWSNSLFYATLRGQALFRTTFDGKNPRSQEKLLDRQYGRLRDVSQGSDGALYVITTSGKLLRVRPK